MKERWTRRSTVFQLITFNHTQMTDLLLTQVIMEMKMFTHHRNSRRARRASIKNITRREISLREIWTRRFTDSPQIMFFHMLGIEKLLLQAIMET